MLHVAVKRPQRVFAWAVRLTLVAMLVTSACGSDDIAGDTSINVDGSQVRLIDRRIESQDASPVTVVLLHGASYDATDWIRTGIVARLAERNVGSVAVDLPGYGGSAANDTERGRFLRDLVDELGIENPVLVAPSMSGSYALPALDQDPTRFAGFVPVAPVGVEDFETLPNEEAPTTMIVWGANDTVIPPSMATTLSVRIPNSWIEKVPDAGHAVMDDQPELLADLLSSFVAALEPLL